MRMFCPGCQSHDVDLLLQALIGASPLVTLEAENLHAQHLAETLPQPSLRQSFTCSRLRVCIGSRPLSKVAVTVQAEV